MTQTDICYQFHRFELDTRRRQLSHNGNPIDCPDKSIDLLLKLLQADNYMIDKNTLLEEIWDGLIVTDWSLYRLVSDTRQLLYQYEPEQEIIQTLRSKGFKIHASVDVYIKENKPKPDSDSIQDKTLLQTQAPPPLTSQSNTKREQSFIAKNRLALLSFVFFSLIVAAYQMDVFSNLLDSQQADDLTQESQLQKHMRLTVLPVEVLTNDVQDEWVKYGIMSMIIKQFQSYEDIDITDIDTTLKTLSSIQYQRDREDLFSYVCASLGCTDLMLIDLSIDENNQLRLSYNIVDKKGEHTQKTNFIGNNILDSASQLFEHSLQQIMPTLPERRLINHTYSDNPNANMDYAIGVHRLYHGDFNSAFEYLNLALKREPSFTWAKIYLADLLFRQGNYQQASSTIDELNKQSLDISQEVRIALIQSNIAYDLGELQQSVDISMLALSKIEAYEDMELLGSTHMNIGTSLQALGQLDDAIAHLQKALSLFREFDFTLREAQAIFNLANTMWLKTLDPEVVLPQYEEAGRIFRRLGANYYLAFTKNMSGGVKVASKRYDVAKRDLVEAASLFKSLGNMQNLLWIDLDLADIALREENFAEAENIALKTYEQSGDINYVKGHASGLLAVLYLNTEQLEKAKFFIAQRTNNEWFDPRPVFSMLEASLAHASGNFAQAVALAEQLKVELGNGWQPGHQAFLDAFRTDLKQNTRSLFDYGIHFPDNP